MPIIPGFQKQPIDDQKFHEIDYNIMKLIFDIHNHMGRFWEEKIYQNELARRCRQIGLGNVQTEVPIHISYKDLKKIYLIDLLINDSILYELKTVSKITDNHWNQTLNYLFLTGLQHGKIINMRPEAVEHRFVSTKITFAKRFDFKIDDVNWLGLDSDNEKFKAIIIELIGEWGAYLDIHLFYEAMVHFGGGEEQVIKRVNVVNHGEVLGTQKLYQINDSTGFVITSILRDEYLYEIHLRRFISFLPIKALQWINFKRDKIIFWTILKKS